MEISHSLKLTGGSELPEALELDKDYLISVNVGIDSIKKQSDEKGGFGYIYTGRLRTCEVLKSNGSIMKATVKGSMSKKMRSSIWAMQADFKPEMDEEMFYQRVMSYVLDNLQGIVREAVK